MSNDYESRPLTRDDLGKRLLLSNLSGFNDMKEGYLIEVSPSGFYGKIEFDDCDIQPAWYGMNSWVVLEELPMVSQWRHPDDTMEEGSARLREELDTKEVLNAFMGITAPRRAGGPISEIERLSRKLQEDSES